MSGRTRAPLGYVAGDVADMLPAGDLVDWAERVPGEVVRQVEGRTTKRLTMNGQVFYLKLHQAIRWREILKNWLSLKQPVYGARNEFLACRHLESKGLTVPAVAAFAESPGALRSRRSFVLTRSLGDVEDLESVTLRWQEMPPADKDVRRLVMQVADVTRQLHDAGVVHRDFYICHLLRSRSNPERDLAVLDLHRALIFDRLPVRWRRRDLAALLFSVLDLPLDRRSWLRFVRVYTGRPLRQTFAEEARFWRGVYTRALQLKAKARRKGLLPGGG